MTRQLPLNADQRAAVNAASGALLILAGAGTGKTHTVIARIARLLADGVPPENILAVTFTNKAAAELKTRLRRQFAENFPVDRLLACTFHSLGLQILRRDPAAAGLEKKFSIVDQGEQIAIARKVSRHVRGDGKLAPPDFLAQISHLKNAELSVEEFSRRAMTNRENALAAVYRKYQETLRLRGAVDFDDLLLRAHALLKNHPPARDYWTARFQHIIVDEFQDASDLQYQLVKTLAQKWGNVCAVGDDDQSIYSWRGAAPRHILNFGQDWRGATIIALRENYRSTNAILKVANAIIANNLTRHKKELFSPRESAVNPPRLIECENPDHEAALIVGEIKKRVEEQRNAAADFAIIVRANALTAPFEEKLLAAKLPFTVIGGAAFFDSKEVRDLLAFLTAVENPRDDGALRRIIDVPPRGIGEKTIAALVETAAKKACPLAAVLAHPDEADVSAAKNHCRDFAAKLAEWRNFAQKNPRELTAKILADTDYHREVESLYDQPQTVASRMEMAREVGEDAARFIDAGGTLADYLAETALNQTRFAGADKKAAAAVKIITIHSAKGLEFPVVYVAGVEENNLPHRRSIDEDNIDEERRLFYVAVTRARDELTVSYCRARGSRSGQASPQLPSRFLGEIPPELFAKTSCMPSAADIAARLAEMRAKLAQ